MDRRDFLKTTGLVAGGLTLSEGAEAVELPAPGGLDGLGVNIHFTDPRPGEMEMLSAAGFRWVRMDFTWAATERVRGSYDFAPYERLLNALSAHKIRALFILDYGNPLHGADQAVTTAVGRRAFARWAAAAVERFRGRGVVWEIWNEPNISHFWKPRPDVEQYAALALETARAIRAAAAGETIVGPATSTVDLAFLEGCFKAGLLQWWDAVSVHPYRQSAPESAAADYSRLRRLIAQYAPSGKAIPILSGEWGYSSAWKGFDDDKQAKMLARQWLGNLAQRVPLSIWYDWHDDGNDPREPEHHFGTVAFDDHPGRAPIYDAKPAYLAAKTLTSLLDGYRLAKRIVVGGADDYALLFQRGQSLRLAVWTTAAEPRDVKVPSGPCKFELVDHLGARRAPLSAAGGSLTLRATDAPQYLLAEGPNPILVGAAEARPLRVSWAWGDTALVARVENLSSAAFQGTARLAELQGLEPTQSQQSLALAGDAEAILRFPMSARPVGTCRVGLRVEADGGALQLSVPARGYAPVDGAVLAACRIVPDGDPKVASEQSIAPAPGESPPPEVNAPVWKLRYRFADGWKFLRLAVERAELRPIAGRPQAIGVWLHGDGGQTSPRLRVVDAKGQTWQPSAETIDWKGWRYVEFELSPSTPHWGGANDGVLHYPLAWDSLFLLDNPSRTPRAGAIRLAAPVLID